MNIPLMSAHATRNAQRKVLNKLVQQNPRLAHRSVTDSGQPLVALTTNFRCQLDSGL